MVLVDLVRRWLTAAGVLLAPLLVFVLPPLVLPGGDSVNAEEQTRLFAEQGFPFQGLAMQITGAVLLVPAVLGIAGIVQHRRRGLVLGVIGLAIGMISAFALLLALGFELGMAFVLTNEADKDVAIGLGLAMGRWWVFGTLLGLGLSGFFLALPILALGLWRSRVIPLVVPALFLLPLLVSLVPMPPMAATLVPSLGFMVPCGWIAVQVFRRAETTPVPASGLVAGRRPAEPGENLSMSEASV
jgi:hypothetical protein